MIEESPPWDETWRQLTKRVFFDLKINSHRDCACRCCCWDEVKEDAVESHARHWSPPTTPRVIHWSISRDGLYFLFTQRCVPNRSAEQTTRSGVSISNLATLTKLLTIWSSTLKQAWPRKQQNESFGRTRPTNLCWNVFPLLLIENWPKSSRYGLLFRVKGH